MNEPSSTSEPASDLPSSRMLPDASPLTKPRLVEIVERGVIAGGVHLATAMNNAPRSIYARAPLIVLPDIGFVWQDYLCLLTHYAGERRVFALDWPGFGASAHPAPKDYTYSDQQFAQTMAAWIDNLGIGRAVLLSTGVSAAPAIRYAAAHPRRVLGLALISPIGLLSGGVSSSLARRILRTPLFLQRLDGYVTALLVGPGTTAEARAVLEHHKQLRKAPNHVESIQAYAALWNALQGSHREITRLANTLPIPAMVLRGALDPLVTDGEAHQAAAALGGLGGRGTLAITLPEAGHLPFLQQPERFYQALSGLLETAEIVALESS